MADEVASLLVKITADGSQAVGVLNGVASTVETLANKNASLLNKVSSVGTLAGSVGRVMTKTFGVATAAGLTASAKAAGQLNKELANIGTLSVPTERLHEFKGQIQDIAIATGKSTSDISDGTYQVVSAFGDAADTMEKVEINAKAAKAGLATTTDSINLTSAVTKAYGDTSAQAVQHVADLAFKTVELGQTTFPELASSMQQVTSLSKELGVSQEELFGAYATLTGVTGNAAEVQTQLKAVYTALLKPSANMEAAISKLGYSSGFSMIKTLGFAGTLNALKSATNGSEEEMLGLFNNVRAMPAVMALTGAQSDTFATKLEKMKNASGAATKAFEVQTEGIAKTGFTLEQAKVKMQVAAQNFGESAAPMIADFAGIVDKASAKLSTMSDEERKAIINTGVLTTKIGVGLSVGGKALTLGTKLAGTAKTIGPAVISGITSPVGLATLAIAGVATATYAGVKAYEAYKESQLDLLPNMKQGIEHLNAYKTNLDELNSLQEEAANLKNKMQDSNISDDEYAAAAKRLNEIRDILSEKYHIDMDSSDIDEAIEKAKTLQQTMAASEAKQLADDILQDKGQYDKNKIQLSNTTSEKADFENLSEGASSAKQSLEALHSQYELGAVSEQEYHDNAIGIIKDFNKLSTENTRKEFSKLNETFSANGEFMIDSYESIMGILTNVERGSNKLTNSLQEDINKYSASVSDYEQKSKQFADNALTWLSYDFQNGDSAAIERDINNISTAVKNAGLNMNIYAKQAAVAQSEQKNLDEIWAQGGTDLEKAVNDYISAGEKFGMTAQEARLGGALIKEGFSDLASAANTESGLNNVINSFKELTGETDLTGEQLTQLAKKIGLIPEGKEITINAEGDVSIIDTVDVKVKALEGKTFVVTVETEGDTEGADEVDKSVKELDGKKCTITFTADNTPAIATIDGTEHRIVNYDASTGTAMLLAENGEAMAIIDLTTGKITAIPEEHDTNITATDNTSAGVESAKQNLDSVKDKTVTLTVQTVNVGEGSNAARFGNTGFFKANARGTQNFSGGLAMVNDERGISDNRELIVDRGRAFIPEGRDVILPLSKGAKVYTAAQTKAIMSGLGIPRYASGKNNSDAFTAAKDDWTHYTKTHSVTTSQELEKWLEFQEKYKQNEKDIWDIEEQVFSLQQKLYSERVKESENWLRHEEKYNGMAAADYLAGIDRMKAYTKEYYEQGIINHKEYTEAMADLDEKYIDKRKEQLEELYDLSTDYISEHTYFNDWQDYGDDPLDAYNRVMDRNREALANGELTQKEFDAYGQKLGSSMYSERKEQSLNWLEEQRKYFGMTDEEYVQGLERIKAYTQEYYQQGLIGRREYNEAMTELNHSAWDEASDAYDDMLKEQQDYINKMQEEFQKQEQALRDSWEVEDRRVDMADVQNQLDIYKNAVTDTGRKKYTELEKEMQQLQRDEELYQLQVKNTATIDALQADYETAENMKADYLKNIVTNTDINVSGIVSDLTTKIAGTGDNITNMLGQLLTAFQNFKIEQSYYNDNSQTTINAADNVDVMAVIRKNAGLDR